MKITKIRAGFVFVGAVSAVVTACVSGQGARSEGAGTDVTSSIGGSSGNGGASSVSASTGEPTCGPTLQVCNGSCVQVANDPAHCGACEHSCAAPPGMTAVCAAGTCNAVCQPGVADCNADLKDGCETALLSDPASCGGCAKACPSPLHAIPGCVLGACTLGPCDTGFGDCDLEAANGCETNLMTSKGNCGSCGKACAADKFCLTGVCQVTLTNFVVLDQKDVTYAGIDYLALKVTHSSTESASENWCQDYTNLCLAFGHLPTGCGALFNVAGYAECKSVYKSDGISDTLGCNPSVGVAAAAVQAGFVGASAKNSFGFHYCGPTCTKTMCSGAGCNTALSNDSADLPAAYTLCKK